MHPQTLNPGKLAAPMVFPSVHPLADLDIGGGLGVDRAKFEVLVVDDSLLEREHLMSILAAAGIAAREAPNGAKGVEMALQFKPAMIFLDIMMPEMDGFAVVRALQKRPETASIPVVMVSSKSNRSDKVWAEAQGAVGYVTKPYTAEQILAQIARAR